MFSNVVLSLCILSVLCVEPVLFSSLSLAYQCKRVTEEHMGKKSGEHVDKRLQSTLLVNTDFFDINKSGTRGTTGEKVSF